ncbi:aluminum activated malate transporter-domain-containing protein [Pilobolus umbonatus]|nr:aluminum activated malate transporter-domain-containing protein [Pilobolus umbonatus]
MSDESDNDSSTINTPCTQSISTSTTINGLHTKRSQVHMNTVTNGFNGTRSFETAIHLDGRDEKESGHDVMRGSKSGKRDAERFSQEEVISMENSTSSMNSSVSRDHPILHSIRHSAVYRWTSRQYMDASNRYAFQMCVAFTISALFVIIDPVSDTFPNVFWIGVSVVTVLDNTVGGILSLSLQRLIGTLIGGLSSMVIMTVTRLIFHPQWNWKAEVLLASLMFIQVFFIAKIKMRPNMSYAGGIGLLTTVIILLSGYSDLVNDRLSYCAELAAWRILNLIIGIVVAMMVSLFVFPVKASGMMRKNLGKVMEDAARLYEQSSEYYLNFSGESTSAVDETLTSNRVRRLPTFVIEQNKGRMSISEIISRIFSTQPPDMESNIQHQIRQRIEESHDFWTHESITEISNEAFNALVKLQTESNRLVNVTNELYIRIIPRLLRGGKETRKKHIRRSKRYNDAIEAMRRIVWPLVSFRLLLPLISLSKTFEHGGMNGAFDVSDKNSLQEKITPTKDTMLSFQDSLRVMRKLSVVLSDINTPLKEFTDDWIEINRLITAGTLHIQNELKQTVQVAMYYQNMDGLKTISYYGFLVRCSMIWDGLMTVAEKLGPSMKTLRRRSIMDDRPNVYEAECVPVPE